MTRPYRRRELVCPIERCGRSFHTDDAAAAATHIDAPHTVCSCGWVGVSYSTHLGKRAAGQVCELHHRIAVVKAKAGSPASKVTPIRRRRQRAGAGPAPVPAAATLDQAWAVISALGIMDRGALAHELAEWLEHDDPMPRAWSR